MPSTLQLESVDSQPDPNSATALIKQTPLSLLSRLRAGGLRVTGVRTAMLAAMVRHPAPITLRELQADVGPLPVAFATHYRCMLRFEAIGLVRRTIDLDGTTRWELNEGKPQEFHVMCRRTGMVTGLDAESSAELRRLLEKIDRRLRSSGYTDLRLNISFYGLRDENRERSADAISRQQVA